MPTDVLIGLGICAVLLFPLLLDPAARSRAVDALWRV